MTSPSADAPTGHTAADLSFHAQCQLPFPLADVFAWHERPGALARLTPPGEDVDVVSRRGTIHEGDVTTLRVKGGPMHFQWEARHFDFQRDVAFKDEQVHGPFASWIHEHRFTANAGGTFAQDLITFRVPGGTLGEVLGRGAVEKKLHRLFAHRYAALAGDLAWHAAYQGPPLRVLVAGSGGMVGRALCAFLSTGGHHVIRLVRASSKPDPDAVGEAVVWNPYAGTVDTAALGVVDAVVNLAGENVAGGRWTAQRKAELTTSRVDVTKFLATLCTRLHPKPAVLINASAMGFYGERGDEVVDEGASRGEGFLGDLCVAWEAATNAASDAGIRVVLPRISLVLSPREGVLAKMLPVFRAGVGGRMGSGQQWMTWITLDDLVGLLHRALFDTRYEGPINACTPEAVRNAAFASQLGTAVGRPAFLPVPAVALKLALGEMGQVATSSTRMAAKRLVQWAFPYRFATLPQAFTHLLGLHELPPLHRNYRVTTVSYDKT